jgi:hypothetical protein
VDVEPDPSQNVTDPEHWFKVMFTSDKNVPLRAVGRLNRMIGAQKKR